MAVVVKFDHLPQIVSALQDGIETVVRETANSIAREAKEQVPSLDWPGPFATGALQAAIYVVTEAEDGYAEATSEARHVRDSAPLDIKYFGVPRAEVPFDDFVTAPYDLKPMPGWIMAAVVAPVEYAWFIENGIFDKPPAGRAPGPFMAPAAQLFAESFIDGCQAVIDNLSQFEVARVEAESIAKHEAREIGLARGQVRRDKQYEMEELMSVVPGYNRLLGAKQRRRGNGRAGLTIEEAMQEIKAEAQSMLDRR